ncbi:tyrosine-type recombinase/integrase [Mesorhizobium sp. M1348]|uniref:tyrosine-type recombinase/integrase n=1 Tax=Mesorhizobium sp. M1348 TaxID=2957089 RepID=UPI00333ACA2B
MGIRDRAVLLPLARLGLRAGDISGMRLDDIDWREGTLRVRGKGRREVQLPLPQDAGDAIIDYLRDARPPFGLSSDMRRSRSRPIALRFNACSRSRASDATSESFSFSPGPRLKRSWPVRIAAHG